ncbi:phosphodiester glycosidase family protein [Paenibacillus sp. YN15]|nr:phosphodiester glycosidase family protein [Paenibacillus sp. YN15]RAV02048.1 phosphodiester glycosidase family protein [Paenibacillus sp. YN15]
MPTPSQPQTAPSARTQARKAPRKKKRHPFVRILTRTALTGFVLAGGFAIWFYLTPWGTQYRNIMVDTLITTQHRHWGKYLVGEAELKKRVDAYWKRFDEYAETPIVQEPVIPAAADVQPEQVKKELLEVEEVEGKGAYGYYKGYILHVRDPKKLRIVVPGKVDKGEKVSAMVKRTGALAGVNGGGFADPEWKGNGFQPAGIVMSGGKIFYLDADKTTKLHVVGIDADGKMIAGKYSAEELLKMNMSEAVTFSPRFIVNGEGQIKNAADGWGVAPRTAMAQTADGTIMFAIIDGRQTHSIGVTLYEIQQLFLERGAIIAANLDGGSSTVLVKDNQIINKPSSEYGERYLPTAWLAFDDPAITIKNIWEGIDISTIDPSKW